MKKTLLAPLLVCIVALLFTLPTAVHATLPKPASGDWKYALKPGFPIVTKVADGNTFKYGEESGTWTGAFIGTSNDVFALVMHPEGFVTCQGLIAFTGTVDGKSGTLTILFVGKRTLSTGLWYGQWVILGGTDALAGLHGQGNWWGPPLDLDYAGVIHFN
jgi:hypothetical protein